MVQRILARNFEHQSASIFQAENKYHIDKNKL